MEELFKPAENNHFLIYSSVCIYRISVISKRYFHDTKVGFFEAIERQQERDGYEF